MPIKYLNNNYSTVASSLVDVNLMCPSRCVSHFKQSVVNLIFSIIHVYFNIFRKILMIFSICSKIHLTNNGFQNMTNPI